MDTGMEACWSGGVSRGFFLVSDGGLAAGPGMRGAHHAGIGLRRQADPLGSTPTDSAVALIGNDGSEPSL